MTTEFTGHVEERWAGMLTRLGWKWAYKPFSIDGYVPDFLIVGECPLVVGVAPLSERKAYEALVAGVKPAHWAEFVISPRPARPAPPPPSRSTLDVVRAARPHIWGVPPSGTSRRMDKSSIKRVDKSSIK